MLGQCPYDVTANLVALTIPTPLYLSMELQAKGVKMEVELRLRRREQLKVNAIPLQLGDEQRTEWSVGETGQGIKRKL